MFKTEQLIRAIALVGIHFLSACQQAPLPPTVPRPALVQVVSEQKRSSPLSILGEVKPRFESLQAFRIDGKILERKVEVGDVVKKGQVLARLDPKDYQLSNSATLAGVNSAEADYALAQNELERQKQLFAKQFISASALDKYQAQLKIAAARVAEARAQANVTTNKVHYTDLTADRPGLVTFIRAEPGQVVKAGESIASIADMHDIDVQLDVPESRLAQVKLNAPVKVRAWTNREKIYSGSVREIAPMADPVTRTYKVKIKLLDADAALKLGMTAGVNFDVNIEPTAPVIIIPNGAITEVDSKKIVWVIDEHNQAQMREVSLGAFSEAGTPILEGLQAGERIVIAGVHTLVKGQLVRPVTNTESDHAG